MFNLIRGQSAHLKPTKFAEMPSLGLQANLRKKPRKLCPLANSRAQDHPTDEASKLKADLVALQEEKQIAQKLQDILINKLAALQNRAPEQVLQFPHLCMLWAKGGIFKFKRQVLSGLY